MSKYWSDSERKAYIERKERIRNEVKCMFRAGFSQRDISKKMDLSELSVRRMRAALVKSGELFCRSRREILVDNFCTAVAERAITEIGDVLDIVERYRGISVKKVIEGNIRSETRNLIRELLAVLAREREVRKREVNNVKQG